MSPNPKVKSESYSNFGGINQKASFYATGDNDCLNILNYSFIKPGALTSTPGSAPFMSGAVSGRITGLYEYEKLSGASFVFFTANTNAYYALPTGPVPVRVGLTNNLLFDFVTFVDTLFAANGSEFFTWDGSLARSFSSPSGSTATASLGVAAAGLSGTFQYAYGYLTTTGYFSDVGARATLAVAGTQAILTGFTYPLGFGITSSVIYRTSAGGQDLFLLGYLPFGGGTFVDTGATALSSFPEPDTFFFTLAPRYIDIYQNSFFMLGFSTAPSTLYWSELAAPETILPDSTAELRTNDGDEIRGSRNYDNALYVFKERSFGKIVGNDSSNFSMVEVSDQFGTLSNRSIIVYEDIILWLDRKGVARYNGSTPEIISNKIENTFLRMNLNAARLNACAVHNRLRNEIWWGVPLDGATTNSHTIIYDYLANSWTVKQGFEPSSMAMVRATFDQSTAFYGSYSGSIHYTSASLFNNNGVGQTYVMQSRFYNIGGPSTTMQYRRLFVDHDPIVGVTVPMQVNFRVNEQSAIAATAMIYLTSFQSRIDFGIPAKSLSVELVTSGASFPVRVNGFTIEGRMQRKV